MFAVKSSSAVRHPGYAQALILETPKAGSGAEDDG